MVTITIEAVFTLTMICTVTVYTMSLKVARMLELALVFVMTDSFDINKTRFTLTVVRTSYIFTLEILWTDFIVKTFI